MSEPQEKILLSFLKELVSEKKPPDFTAEILRRIDQQHSTEEAQTPNDFLPDRVFDDQIEKPPTVQVTPPPSSLARRAQWAVWLSRASAAVLLIAAVGIVWWLLQPGAAPIDNTADQQPADPQVNETLPELSKRARPPGVPADNLVEKRSQRKTTQIPDKRIAKKRDDIPADQTKLVFPGPFRRTEMPGSEAVSVSVAASNINRTLSEAWRSQNIRPADRLNISAWVNRLSNRVIGRTPNADEMQEINKMVESAEDENQLRQELVELFINDQNFQGEFNSHWAQVLAWRLLGISTYIGVEKVVDPDMTGTREFIADAIAKQKPLDQLAYELISATGSSDSQSNEFNPAVSYMIGVNKRFFASRELVSSHISDSFLGHQTRCAQCHDDDQTSQQVFWDFHSFFAQMRIERPQQSYYLVNRNFLPFGKQGRVEAPISFTDGQGETREAFPRFKETRLGTNGFVAKVDRRTELANLIACSQQWREALVDHVWASLLNVPITGVEGNRDNANANLNELRESLGTQLAANDFQLEWLVTSIVLSDAFALGAGTDAQIAADNPYLGNRPVFSRFYHRYASERPPAMTLAIVAGAYQSGNVTEANVAGLLARVGDAKNQPKIKAPRVIQPYLPNNENQWATSESISRQLDRIAQSEMTHRQKVEHLVLAALGRPVRENEMESALTILENSDNHRIALQDIWWSLLNSIEFQLPLNVR